MYIGKETRTKETGSYRLVPYCKECKSMDIETIQTCKECGSHNVGTPSFDDLLSDDELGRVKVTQDYEVHIYSCDNCGKKFDGLREPNTISYSDYGEFFAGSLTEEYGDTRVIHLEKDLCKECQDILVDDLNLQLEQVAKKENVYSTIERLFKKESDTNE